MLEALGRIDRAIAKIDKLVGDSTSKSPPKFEPIWSPFPGPQSMAYLSPADELFYGGAAGF